MMMMIFSIFFGMMFQHLMSSSILTILFIFCGHFFWVSRKSILFETLENYLIENSMVSNFLVYLTLVMVTISVLITIDKINLMSQLSLVWFYLLFIFLLLSFLETSLLMFYVFFEASLIPMFLIIMGWGYQPERWSASIALLVYTITSSLPLLTVLLVMNKFNISTNMVFCFKEMSMMSSWMTLLTPVLMLAFLVKCPVFSVHLWLPKAHVEAPTSGSMLLASILLKLGAYGIFRLLPLGASNLMLNIITSLTLIGGALISMLCLNQTDLKVLIAYSSVAHMSVAVGSLLSMTFLGLKALLLVLVAHGLSSSAMFNSVGLFYNKFHSRNLLMMGGLLNVFPFLTLLWFIACMGNMAAPPSLNLLSEIMAIGCLLLSSLYFAIPLIILVILAGGYSLVAFSGVASGQGPLYSMFLKDFTDKDLLGPMTHVPILLFGWVMWQ